MYHWNKAVINLRIILLNANFDLQIKDGVAKRENGGWNGWDGLSAQRKGCSTVSGTERLYSSEWGGWWGGFQGFLKIVFLLFMWLLVKTLSSQLLKFLWWNLFFYMNTYGFKLTKLVFFQRPTAKSNRRHILNLSVKTKQYK